MKRIIAFASITFVMAFTLFAVAHADDNVTYEDVLASLQAYYAGLISKEDADAVLNQYLSGQNSNSGSSGSSSSTSGSSSSSRNVRSVSQGTAIPLATALATTAPVATRSATGNLEQTGPSGTCGGVPKPDVVQPLGVVSDFNWLCNGRQWVKVEYGSRTPDSQMEWETPGVCSPSRNGYDPNTGERVTQTNPNYNAADCANAQATATAQAVIGPVR